MLLGGAAAPAGLLDAARAARVPVVTTYGMTETCGGCVYDGIPLDGVRVRIGDDGRIWIGGPVLFSGYRAAGGARGRGPRDWGSGGRRAAVVPHRRPGPPGRLGAAGGPRPRG